MGDFLREEDLVVIVWANLSEKSDFRGRPYETMIKASSSKPIAWRLSFLHSKYAELMSKVVVLESEDAVREHLAVPLLLNYTKDAPVLVPLRFARSVLGWVEFDVWEESDV